MPRQLLDAFGHVRQLTVITPIARGGTAADNAPQAVDNLQGINRNKISVPLGVAGTDYRGRLHRKYLEGAGIFSGITIEGPTELVKSSPGYDSRPLFFISNMDTKAPPVITIDDQAAMASLVITFPTFTFSVPQTGSALTITINDRDYVFPLVDNGIIKPVVFLPDESVIASNAVIDASKFATVAIGNISQPSAWHTLPSGETAINQVDGIQGIMVEGRAGATGHIVVSNGEDVFALPKSQIRFTVPSLKHGFARITLNGDAVARYAVLSNIALYHTATTIEIALDELFTNVIYQQQTSQPAYSFPISLTDGEYYVRVKYHSNGLMSPWSDTKKITVDSGLNVMNEIGVITDPVLFTSGNFGNAVAVNHALLAIGEPDFGETGIGNGCVSLFLREGYTHRYLDRVISPNMVASGEHFGMAVSFSVTGDLYIGAPDAVGGGAVYHYTYDGENILYQGTITPRPNSVKFGHAIKATENGLFIGDPSSFVNGPETGAVHFYSKSESGFTYVETIYPTTPTLHDHFGISITATSDSSAVVIGSTSPVITDTVVGKFYIFSIVNGHYTEAVVRNSPMPEAGFRFARSLDYDASKKKLYVGCEGDNTMGPSTGGVYVFDCDLSVFPASPLFDRRILPSNGESNMCFGASVGVTQDGYRLYVGSRKYALNNVELGSVFFLS